MANYGIGSQDVAKAYDERSAAKAAYVGQAPQTIVPNDPVSARAQVAALYEFIERLSTQRNRLRELADFVVGGEPESGQINGAAQTAAPPVGGITAEVVGCFELAGSILRDIDRQIERLQRISS